MIACAPVATARQEAEAHELLSEIYGWFTEGFDTKDLQEAQALLERVLSALSSFIIEKGYCQ